MSGLPSRQHLNFLELNTAGTPFDRVILEHDIRAWFESVNQRHALGPAGAPSLSNQIKRALKDPSKEGAANAQENLTAFKAALPHASDQVKEFIAYGLREGLYASVANSVQFVGSIDNSKNIFAFKQKSQGEGIEENYKPDETDPNTFEYELTYVCEARHFFDQKGEIQERSKSNELTLRYKIKVTLPEEYDFQDQSIDRIQYTITGYDIDYTDYHKEELLFAKRSEVRKDDEVAIPIPALDSDFFRFTNGFSLPDQRILTQAQPLKDQCEIPGVFLGFFHQAMVYQKSNGKLVFVAKPFEIDQKSGSDGNSKELKAILDFCTNNKIEAEIISPVAEMSYPIWTTLLNFARRQHFVTYHYKVDAIDFLESDVESDVESEHEKQMLISANCYDSKTKLWGFATDAQSKLVEELEPSVSVNRHYVGCQPNGNDIDCGYWAKTVAQMLLHHGALDLEQRLRTPLASAQMQATKKFALSAYPYHNRVMNLGAALLDKTQSTLEGERPSSSPTQIADPQLDNQDDVEQETGFEIVDDVSTAAAAIDPRIERATPLVVTGLLLYDLPPVVTEDMTAWELSDNALLVEDLQRKQNAENRYKVAFTERLNSIQEGSPILMAPRAVIQPTVQQELTVEPPVQQERIVEPPVQQEAVQPLGEEEEVEPPVQPLGESTVDQAPTLEQAPPDPKETLSVVKDTLRRILDSVDDAVALKNSTDDSLKTGDADPSAGITHVVTSMVNSVANQMSLPEAIPSTTDATKPSLDESKSVEKPKWFAGWRSGHFAAALGLVLLSMTLVLIPLAIYLWREKLKPSIQKNLANQTPAQRSTDTDASNDAEVAANVLNSERPPSVVNQDVQVQPPSPGNGPAQRPAPTTNRVVPTPPK